MRVAFRLTGRGRPHFDVLFQGRRVASGACGLEFANTGSLADNFTIASHERTAVDRTYDIPVGKASSARDRHHQLRITLVESAPPRRRIDVVFRVFNDGVAFRYVIPQQDAFDDFVLTDESTELSFAADAKIRFLALNGYTTPYEAYYDERTASEISADSLVGLPMLVEHHPPGEKGTWLAVTEANLVDYAGMYLAPGQRDAGRFSVKLSPLPGRQDEAKVLGTTPHRSPWRVLMIADNLATLIESNIIFHVSDPPAIADTSWIRPGKTTFPWWNGYVLEGVDFQPGLNTRTHKHYIDFCAKHGIEYHSLDGTDTAWYGGPIIPDGPTDITTAVPEIDLPELLRHARQKGVRLRLWMHWRALKPQIDQAFAQYEKWGIEGVMVDFMDRDDQEMVAFLHEVARKAAQHHLTVTWHGVCKPTGMERTWPNVLTYEGVLNQEYNKWSQRGTPPQHNVNVALIRMLAGPLDYHHGGMRNTLPQAFRPRNEAPLVQGTRGHQLAMYVVYQDHLPMMVDHPAAYEGEPGLELLASLPVSWDQTEVVHADFGRSIVVARRKGGTWYLGGMAATAEPALRCPLDFLGSGSFSFDLYRDDPSGGPTALKVEHGTVRASESLRTPMTAGGGFVARFSPSGR